MRVAGEVYSTAPGSLTRPRVHLTNSTLNREAGYGAVGGGLGVFPACLQPALAAAGLDWQQVWPELRDAALHTVLLAEETAARAAGPSSYSGYKLLGLDVLLDSSGRPWVLEVNTDPCLFADPVR